MNYEAGESFLLLGFKPVLAECDLQTETSWRGPVNTRAAGCCWAGMLFRRAGARDPAGLFTAISGGASHDGVCGVWSAESSGARWCCSELCERPWLGNQSRCHRLDLGCVSSLN